MALQSIESRDLTVAELFQNFYVVPSYQREYVWREPEVEQLLFDIHNEYMEGRGAESQYFIGSIVVLSRSDGVFELIDGQQRMTTTFLMLCAIRDRLRRLEPRETTPALDAQIQYTDVDQEGRNVPRYRVELQYEDSKGVLQDLARTGDPATIPAATRSTDNILNAYQLICAFLEREFSADAAQVRRFYAYFTKQIKLIRVETGSVAHALKVFETINDRGVGLDSMDLLKNLLFMRAAHREFELLKTVWKDLVDTLHRAREKPLRFLRYYIFSTYDAERLKEEEIYGWFQTHESECGYGTDPLGFARKLLAAATAFVRFIGGKDSEGRPNRYLENIHHLSGAARQHLILLLAGRDLSESEFSVLARELENLFFTYVITREPTRDFEHRFARWARDLRHVRTAEELDRFLASSFRPSRAELSRRFSEAFARLKEDDLQKYRLRYVLARLTQHVDEQAFGIGNPRPNLSAYIGGQSEVEHILPQRPTTAAIEAFGGSKVWTENVGRLGNLTLLEKAINASLGNGTFAEKREAYRQSNFLLTRSLAGAVQVGVRTPIDLIGRKLELFQGWTSEDIERRQAMLARLAHEAWDVPLPEETSTLNS